MLLTNPPFAGDIKDSRILHQYELAKKWQAIDVESLTDPEERDKYLADPYRHAYQSSGMWGTKQSRDVLFVERNFDFLKPGGRMAIVLPQGRLNNIGDGALRWWVSGKARILAVIGLHVNTFKPHTGTKTSVLFLQKFNDDPDAGAHCPSVEDYPIFFAVSQHPGKDNSGEYIYLKGLDGLPLLDLFGHKIIDHDLYDIYKAVRSQLERLLDRDKDNPKKCNKHLNHYHAILPFIPRNPTIAEAFEQFAKDQGFSFWEEE